MTAMGLNHLDDRRTVTGFALVSRTIFQLSSNILFFIRDTRYHAKSCALCSLFADPQGCRSKMTRLRSKACTEHGNGTMRILQEVKPGKSVDRMSKEVRHGLDGVRGWRLRLRLLLRLLLLRQTDADTTHAAVVALL